MPNNTWEHITQDFTVEIEYIPGKRLASGQSNEVEDVCHKISRIINRLQFNLNVGGWYDLVLTPADSRADWTESLDIKPQSGRIKISIPDWFTFEEKDIIERGVDDLISVARAVDIVRIEINIL